MLSFPISFLLLPTILVSELFTMSTSLATPSIGFIGLGIMGKGMVKNLITKLDQNIEYVVWNRFDNL
jgi:hypothetical protein